MKRVLLTLFAGTLLVCFAVGAAPAQERPQWGTTALSDENPLQTAQDVRVVGILKKQGITSHLPGTHTIRDRSTGRLYALQSRSPELLDRHTGRRVVYGARVPGLPRGSGPPLLDALWVVPLL